MNNSDIIVNCENVCKSYRIGKIELPVLANLNLVIERSSWNAILGASGSGKTTLLNLIGTLERFDSGKIEVDNVNYQQMSANAANLFRRRKIGFVFQSYHLLPELSVLENVMLPGLFNLQSRKVCNDRALMLLEKVGLSGRLKHRPQEMSGGEQQRCAIARALINSPEIILADEPTGNLDKTTGHEILQLFHELQQTDNHTIIMITHSTQVAQNADKIFYLENGSFKDEVNHDI